MDVIASLRGAIAHGHGLIDATMGSVTDTQFNWTPPGTVNPIQTALLHMVGGEDFFVQQILQGRPLLWQTQGWGEKIGVAEPPRPGGDWTATKTKPLPLGEILAYQASVRAATDAYLAKLSPDVLDKPATFPGYPRPVTMGDVLTILGGHIAFHAGEISAVKGVQGEKGLPF
jgi:hypothetical protein